LARRQGNAAGRCRIAIAGQGERPAGDCRRVAFTLSTKSIPRPRRAAIPDDVGIFAIRSAVPLTKLLGLQPGEIGLVLDRKTAFEGARRQKTIKKRG
jgi:hypothetical protein